MSERRLATRLSPQQLVTLWAELVEAYHGINGFGGDTAEIYAYALLDRDPTADSALGDSEIGQHARLESTVEAGLAMHEVLAHFCREWSCSAEIDGWASSGTVVPFDHRVRVRIIHEKGPTP